VKIIGINGTLRIAVFVICLTGPICSTAGQTPASDEVLRVPSRVRGYVGGESHDTYRIAVTKGERLKIQLAWRRTKGNRAEATLSASPDFGAGESLPSGRWTRDGRRWVGTIDKSGVIYLFVVAHPSAHYTVTIRRTADT
jgi:hypothetical protein